MTESLRRSGEYENPQGPQGDAYQGAYPQQQHASTPVNPEWPPPPAHQPTQQAAQPVTVEPRTAQLPGYAAVPPQYTAEHPEHTTEHSAHAKQKRTRGPIALLAAVAIVAAAVGGGTAYAFQELTGKNDTVSSSTTTSVVPSSKKGDVATIAAAVSPSVVEITATLSNGTSTGSGVVISSSNGEIITNNHVISGAQSIKATTSTGKSYTAKVVGTDSAKDLALVKLQGASGLKTATLGNSDGVQVGDTVVAIGSPEGLSGTVTSGIVSALNRDVTVSTDEGQDQQSQGSGGDGQWPFSFGGRQFNGDTGSSTTTYKAIQTDASLNPGNSGGALIDAGGNIIGINSAMYSASSDSSSSSSDAGSVGLGFAIPINTVKSDLAKLRAGSTS
ncbi:trypsin-like peptidase domain-containing protein [Streptomyces sp. NPDC096040]|uniref:S1C family serine protease n=1 Tax=Streptomyces sp. NPDC096040 TaxID=3155541 RepID=UPI00331D4C3D